MVIGRKNLIAVLTVVFLILGLASVSWAGYVIDADLSDWGVTPFTDWVPAGTADYIEADNVNTYNAYNYGETWDYEALYFDDDADNFYFAIVSSYEVGPGSKGGDLGIALNTDSEISEHGVVSGLEYAIQVSSAPSADVVLANPIWSNTQLKEWPDGWQGSPYKASGGDILGSATVAIKNYPLMENGTYILEAAVSRALLPDQDVGNELLYHITNWCGNDSLNLIGTIAIPEPATLIFGLLGLGLVRKIYRKKVLP